MFNNLFNSFSRAGSGTPAGQTPAQRAGLIGVMIFIAFLHLLGWGVLIAIIAPEHLTVGSKAFGIGTGLTAYMLGVRHAFDADHIAAIDNTTRKLVREGRKPRSVGFWFSCGHSSVVFALTLLIAFGVHAVSAPILNESSMLHLITGYVGTIVSGGFLYLIAALNLVVLFEVWTLFKQVRSGEAQHFDLEATLSKRGLINRLLHRVMAVVSKPWQMYIVGLLFGLGFDTATEISLLVLTGTGAASGLPWYATLCLPVLFAAGMSLMDTIDGTFMNAAYGWADHRPLRKLYYNLVVTGLSIASAILIGSVEFIGLANQNLGLHGPVWDLIAAIDLNTVGIAITTLFVCTWALAYVYWRFAGLDDQQTPISLFIRSDEQG